MAINTLCKNRRASGKVGTGICSSIGAISYLETQHGYSELAED
jgi:hypothetical protein